MESCCIVHRWWKATETHVLIEESNRCVRSLASLCEMGFGNLLDFQISRLNTITTRYKVNTYIVYYNNIFTFRCFNTSFGSNGKSMASEKNTKKNIHIIKVIYGRFIKRPMSRFVASVYKLRIITSQCLQHTCVCTLAC